MNRTVKLYRKVKRPSGAWGAQPVPDSQVKILKDLPKNRGELLGRSFESLCL
jgi:hypothetical protein